jgi:L-cysteine:1D-myo-inositol 2-amino-2-deoxy-alpha-D-glucopyranoside ligase
MFGVTAPLLRLYNTETHAVEPVEDGDVGLYVCGVTPYDTSHLGHAFTYTAFDVLVRYLRFRGQRVTYVQNVTDIDDDVLMRAAKVGIDWKALGDREYASFRQQMAALGNLDPDVAPRATEHIPEMIEIVAGLIATGVAYISPGREGSSVYFEVGKDPDFGRLFHEPYEAMLAIANERGNFPADPLKRDPLDFVLWQAQKPGEPAWESPWGPGRPGWHIECSAMSMKYLGKTLAIHGGGYDLIFPHHDAEIAQSETFTGVPFAKHWMHTAMVYCGEHKMSKSLGNMVFVGDLLERYSANALRLHLLSHLYRQPWNHPIGAPVPTEGLASDLAVAFANAGPASDEDLERHARKFLEAVADNLDTPRAIDELSTLASGDERARRAGRLFAEQVLGLRFDTPSRSP